MFYVLRKLWCSSIHVFKKMGLRFCQLCQNCNFHLVFQPPQHPLLPNVYEVELKILTWSELIRKWT